MEARGFGDALTAMVFSSDERYLFAADKKGTIFVYHTQTWVKICRIPASVDFEIENLIISQDSTVLLCSDAKEGKLVYWSLQTDSGALALNLSGNEDAHFSYNDGLMTPNKEFLLLIVGQNDSEVWNLKSRVKMEALNFSVNFQCLQCSPDSKYFFMSCEDSVLLQYNAQEAKEEHKYQFGGRISTLQVDDKMNMHVVTLRGEFEIYNIVSHEKLGELPRFMESEYHWLVMNPE